MRYLKPFLELKLGEKIEGGRTKSISEEEFLGLIKENCKEFSLDNDLLYRAGTKIDNGDFGLFPGNLRRKYVFSKIDNPYNTFFSEIEDKIDEYPVQRMNSLIGKSHGCNSVMYEGNKCAIVIPYDGAKLVFTSAPDLAINFRNKKPTKEDFIMMEYKKGFKVPEEKLLRMGEMHNMDSGLVAKIKSKGWYGFEFFTNSPCLLINSKNIEWLKNNI